MANFLQKYLEITELKKLKRKGWLLRKLPSEACESVADHTFGVAFLALLLGGSVEQKIDIDKAIKMALIHDIAEIYAGDITPLDNISDEVKYQMEKESLIKLFENVPLGESYIELWEEFERNESPEARLVKELDKLEMSLQAYAYNKSHNLDAEEFYASSKSKIKDPYLLTIFNELLG